MALGMHPLYAEFLEKEFIIGYHGFFESPKRKSIQFLLDEKRFIYSGNED